MERSDGVMDTWIGVRYPYYVRIEIKPRQLVRAICKNLSCGTMKRACSEAYLRPSVPVQTNVTRAISVNSHFMF